MTPPPRALLERALDPRVETPADSTSGRILDAALELAAASGLRHLTIDDVAQRAGVGRMTVYRRFGQRDRLVEALAVRECRRVLAGLAGALDPSLPVEDRIADGFVVAMRVSREHPLLERLARIEPETVLATLTAEDGRILELAREFLVGQIRQGQRSGEIPAGDPEPVAELLVRIGVSFVLMPRSVVPVDDEQAARDFARTLIAPIVTRRGS